jgi:hypothetical protein
MREYPRLPGELNELIFAIEDGHLLDVVAAVRQAYDAAPWWALWRRHRLIKSLQWLTVVCEAYRAGLTPRALNPWDHIPAESLPDKKNHNS